MNDTSGHEGEFTQPSIHLLHHLRIHAMDAWTGYERIMIDRGGYKGILSLSRKSCICKFHDRC